MVTPQSLGEPQSALNLNRNTPRSTNNKTIDKHPTKPCDWSKSIGSAEPVPWILAGSFLGVKVAVDAVAERILALGSDS